MPGIFVNSPLKTKGCLVQIQLKKKLARILNADFLERKTVLKTVTQSQTNPPFNLALCYKRLSLVSFKNKEEL